MNPISRTGAVAPKNTVASPSDIRVITFNTASGNSKVKTKQEDFLKLPFYREIIEGKPNAPILAAQEVGDEQLAALQKAAKNGNFKIVELGRPPGYRGQHNMVLVPKRFEIVQAESHYYAKSQAKGLVSSVKTWFGDKRLPSLNELSQIAEPRMWNEVRLKDTATGKTFTVFNTHTTLLANRRIDETKELLDQVAKAKKHGPVIVAGDLNTHTKASGGGPKQDKVIRDLFADAGLKDTDAAPQRIDGRPNIDWILADGFQTVQSRHYTGNSLSLPGSPTAKDVSDHFAEEARLQFR